MAGFSGLTSGNNGWVTRGLSARKRQQQADELLSAFTSFFWPDAALSWPFCCSSFWLFEFSSDDVFVHLSCWLKSCRREVPISDWQLVRDSRLLSNWKKRLVMTNWAVFWARIIILWCCCRNPHAGLLPKNSTLVNLQSHEFLKRRPPFVARTIQTQIRKARAIFERREWSCLKFWFFVEILFWSLFQPCFS